MRQCKIDSMLEALTNVLIGASVAFLSQLLWFPLLDKEFTLTENLITTIFLR